MVSGSRIEGGNGTQNLSAGVRRTIQSIKEIVGDHSDADIYTALKEANMDPNETTQKLLNQDPFHEVKRKKDKKKEVTPIKPPVPIKPRKPTEQLVQETKPNTYSERNPRRAVNNWNNNAPDTRVSRQFRVVRDNRVNQNRHKDMKPSTKPSVSVSTKEPPISNASEKSSSETSKNQSQNPSQSQNMPLDSLSKQVKPNSSSGKRPLVSNVTPPVQATTKTHDLQQSSVTSPNSSVVGVYSSSSDPVHIPSLVSRPSANVGAIKREVGVRRHTSENSQSEREGQFRSFPTVSKTEQPSHSNVSEPVPNVSSGRASNTQYSSRPHQQLATHQKAPQANKEWKPKSSQKPSVVEVGVIGTPKKTASTPPNNSKDLLTEADKLPNSSTHEDQNVIIAPHIRVSETDRIRLTFGSLGIEDSTQASGFQDAEVSHVEPMTSLSASSPVSSEEPSGGVGAQIESVDEGVQGSNSGSISPVSEESEERLGSSSPQNMENFTNVRLVSPSYAPSEPHQQQPSSELPSFSQGYDPQTGYDMSYFRPGTDESSLRGQVLQVPQEGFSSHVANNSIPATTIPMVQQQAPVAQMYPQVHLPHFANLMPYRQFLSPVYVPPMVMPGYSNNPTYSPHPSTGSSYLLMPGVNPPNGLKYAIPQYKSLQAGSPTGFGNFTSPNGYALNTPGVVGSASGIDDSARLKYKDGNVYVPNPQAETSELWMNPRDIPSLQSASYYNMAGQTPHGAYLPSHTAHASFNAPGQSSHVQFSGLYHPQQPGAIANPHHMGGNVAAGAPGSQVGGYQQPQLSQMSWTGNF